MIRRLICVLLSVMLLTCVLASCQGKNEISPKQKEFVIGEEILFEDGKEFTLPSYSNDWNVDIEGEEVKQIKIITAKMVAMEKFSLDNPDNWPYPNKYLFSYKYRIYVKGYCGIEHAGKMFSYTLDFRTVPYNGVNYHPTANYESTVVGEDGYFEFSVDVYMPDVVTTVLPISLCQM